MCKIQPTLDVQNNMMHIDALGVQRLSIPLDYYPEEEIDLKVCGDKGQGLLYKEDNIAGWFSEVLGTQCTLVRKCPTKLRRTHNRCIPKQTDGSQPEEMHCGGDSRIAFANEAQFLLVSEASVDDLNTKLAERQAGLQVDARRFRPNFIVKGGIPFQEDVWIRIHAQGQIFSVRILRPVCMD